jgi:hypothetical protein
MMSLSAKRELTRTTAHRYQASSREEKGRILDEFTAATGYHRKYALTLLKVPPPASKPKPPPRKRKPRYTPPVVRAMLTSWNSIGRPCGKRLAPFLAELVPILERHNELTIETEHRDLLLSMSASTVDRLLRAERKLSHGLSTTKSGTLLKSQIPLHTSADWNDALPGFTEIDLVAHCGETTCGYYLNTLTVTDIHTGWTECFALLQRSRENVIQGLQSIRAGLPFALKGIDSDNGSEFINHPLFTWCKEEGIRFTRCRPYKKNDQAHVEQKNGSIVRRTVGYDRYEGQTAWKRLGAVHQRSRLLVNFFQPSMKIIDKQRDGAKVKKTYDEPKTPYQRVLACQHISDEDKQALTNTYNTLNPAEISRKLADAQRALRQLAVGKILR